MTCTDFYRRVRAYLERSLTDDEMQACREHEQSCASCKKVMAVARETTCHGLTCFLDDYVADALPVAQREIFERHLEICVDCREYLDSYETTVELARRVTCEPEEDAGPGCDLPDGLIDAILAARDGGRDRA